MIRNIIISGLFICIFSLANAQVTKLAMDAIGQNNVQQLLTHFDEQIELCILSDPDFVSKQQAVSQLRKFLGNVKPKSISSFHQGSSKTKGSKYGVANLLTQKGTYRVFVYTEELGGKQIIRELRIDQQ